MVIVLSEEEEVIVAGEGIVIRTWIEPDLELLSLLLFLLLLLLELLLLRLLLL